MMLISWLPGSPAVGQPPTSPRSQKAIAQVRPGLEKDLQARGLKWGAPIFIRIFKESLELEVWLAKKAGFELFRVYEICSYSGELGPKVKQGDLQSPEGFYFVPPSGLNPSSEFHLSFNIGYPNAYDLHHDRTGSAIMVHGNCVSVGCFAMTDRGIEEIYALADAAVRGGQPFFRVHIFPFRMTDDNLEKHGQSPWIGFWRNLKEGYDFFETRGTVPDVQGQDGKYIFEDDPRTTD